MNKKIKVLLVGLGSEIGSTLLSLLKSNSENVEINGILTNKIFKNDLKKNFEAVIARIILNDPSMINDIKYYEKKSLLEINKKKIKIFWGDITKFDVSKIKSNFDFTIIATSKDHINKKHLMKKFLKVSKFVFGVAESVNLPSLYPNFVNFRSNLFEIEPRNIYDFKDKIFALGSCQTNGWQSQLRLIAEIFNKLKMSNLKMMGCELDIVHPDTPQGRLGTKSMSPREQDARNNLRPGFSQVEKSMKKFFNKAYMKNTISLRTLISPPGYQIARFYINYSTRNNEIVSKEYFKKNVIKFCKRNKFKIQYTESSLGSRAFEKVESSSVLLLNDQYFQFNNNFLNKNEKDSKILQIVLQSYVHNTRGYCRSVIQTIKEVMSRYKRKKRIYCWR